MLLLLHLKQFHLMVSTSATKNKCKNRTNPPPATASICVNLFSAGALAGLLSIWRAIYERINIKHTMISIQLYMFMYIFSLPIDFLFVGFHESVYKMHHQCSVEELLMFHKMDNRIGWPNVCLLRYWPILFNSNCMCGCTCVFLWLNASYRKNTNFSLWLQIKFICN